MRDAREEGSMLRRKTEDPFLRLRGKSCQHQTIDDNGQQGCRPGHISMAYNNEQQGGRQGHINITDVEDAFLIDTMDVVSQRGLKRTADSIEQYGPVEHSPRPLCLTSEEFRLDTQTDGIYSRQDIPAASETLRNSSPHPSTQVFPSFSTTATEMTGSCQFEATSSDSASSVSNDSLLNGYPELQGNSILFSEGTESLCSAQKKHRQNRLSRPPLLPPCRVCGDRASGYHYGVNTCEACKGFFRRSICKKGTYVCSGSGGCTTLTGKRTACSYCRFKRCIEVGMSKNAIKTGRYTHELRSKNTMEVKRLQNQNSGDSPRHVSVESPSNHINYTEYQKDLLNKSIVEQTVQSLISGQKMLHEFLDDYYSVDMMQERQLNVYQSFLVKKRIQDLELLIKTKRNTAHAENTNCNIEAGFVNDVPTNDATEPQEDESVVSSSYCERNTLHGTSDSCTNDHTKSTPNGQVANSYYTFSGNEQNNGTAKSVDRDVVRAEVMTTTINDMEQAVQGMLAFAKSVPGFDYLPIEDQASLLKDLDQKRGKPLKRRTFTTRYVQTGRTREVWRHSFVANLFPPRRRPPASRLDIWYIGHIRCFNVELRVGACEWQFHADELAQIWGDAVVDHAFTMSRVAQTLDLTKEETACLRAVCLTFPDRCGLLHSREEVEHIHIQMLDVFKLVSCKRHSDYNKWFIKIINFLVLLREFGAKFELMSKQLKLDWSILKDNPLLLSVFLS